MSGLDDLGRALRDDAAANAPHASVIDVEAVARAARARRRPRLVGAGALAIVGALGLGGLAVGALTPPALIAASESQSSTADAPLAEGGALEAGGVGAGGVEPLGSESDLARVGGAPLCGEATSIAAEGDDRLRLEVQLPASLPGSGAPAGVAASGTLRLVNATGDDLRVQSRPEAVAVLVQDGVVVGQSGVVTDVGVSALLAPGASLDLDVRLLTVSCLDGSALPPGDYTVRVSADVGIDGAPPVGLSVAPVAVRLD